MEFKNSKELDTFITKVAESFNLVQDARDILTIAQNKDDKDIHSIKEDIREAVTLLQKSLLK